MADTRGEASSSERPQLVTVCRSVGAPRRSPGLGSNWSGPLVGRWVPISARSAGAASARGDPDAPEAAAGRAS